MKILVFGQSGQVARALQANAGPIMLECLDRAAADFKDPASCASVTRGTDADAVIIAAAYTAVDQAETDEARAHLINADTPGAIAKAAAERGLPVVHISTDYVFDGQGETPFQPRHPIAPLSAYGRSKAAGEAQVRGAGGTHAILRTSWVFSPDGGNFVKTMLRLGSARDTLRVVDDQIGGPTPAADIARACLSIARQLVQEPAKSGTYHFAAGPDVSWAAFARAIFERAGLSCEVVGIPSSAYPTPAARPRNSRLDMTTTEATFGISRTSWAKALDAVIKTKDAQT